MLYSKSPNEHLKVTLSWATELAIDSTSISAVTWTVPSGITNVATSEAGSNTTIVLSGGTSGVEYSILAKITTSDTKYYEQGIIVQVTDSVGQPTNCYASLFNLASDLGVTSAANLSRLAQLLKQTSRWIEDYTGRKFYLQSGISEYVKADNSTYLFTANYPLRTVTSITYEDEIVASTEYYLASGDVSAIRSVENNWNLYNVADDNFYTVVYDAGYYLPGQANRDLPSDIETACELLVKEAWKSRDRDPSLTKMAIPQVIDLQFRSGSNGKNAVQYQAASLLDKYKIWRF